VFPASGYPRLGEVYGQELSGAVKAPVPVTEVLALGCFGATAPSCPLKFWLWSRSWWLQSSNSEGSHAIQHSVRPCLPRCPTGLYWEKCELPGSGL